MLKIGAVLFLLAAIGGMTMSIRNHQKKSIPWTLAAGHGVLAAAGLIVFIVAALSMSLATALSVSLVLFIIAALGGFVIFSSYLRKQPLPGTLIYVHGLIAVIGFVLLLYGIYY